MSNPLDGLFGCAGQAELATDGVRSRARSSIEAQPEALWSADKSVTDKIARWGVLVTSAQEVGATWYRAPGWAILLARVDWLTWDERGKVARGCLSDPEQLAALCTVLELGGLRAALPYLCENYGFQTPYKRL